MKVGGTIQDLGEAKCPILDSAFRKRTKVSEIGWYRPKTDVKFRSHSNVSEGGQIGSRTDPIVPNRELLFQKRKQVSET